jgi:hypothetical protein
VGQDVILRRLANPPGYRLPIGAHKQTATLIGK